MTTDTTADQRRSEVEAELARATPYELLGGEGAVRRVVEAFYDLMDAEERYAPIRRMHRADLAPMRQSLFEYLSGWLGGPPLHVQRRGTVCMTGPHAPYAIGPTERDLWVECMAAALTSAGVAEKYQELLVPAFDRMARMIQNVG